MTLIVARAITARRIFGGSGTAAFLHPHRPAAAAAFLHQQPLVQQRVVSGATTTTNTVVTHHWHQSPSSIVGRSSSFFSSFARPTTPLCLKMNNNNNHQNISGEEILASMSTREEQTGQNVASAMEALAKADAVCFDVDSTVIAEEGIDVLADFLGQGEAVAALTKSAMEGSQKFQDALAARLELMKPAKHQIEDCLNKMPLKLSPGIEELIEALNDKGVHVYFVSGGFRIMIEPVALEVCVAKDRIYANTILFDDDGNYAGFDDQEPTSADMGKPKALTKIKNENGYKTMVMVGDGATDAQAKPPADAFIGFGGVVVRPAVQEAADWFVTDFADMTNIVEKYAKARLR